MPFFSKLSFKILFLVLFFSLDIASITTEKVKRVPLYIDKENDFFCVGEINIGKNNCRYNILGQQINILPREECEIVFSCNATTLTATCCFEFLTDTNGFAGDKKNSLYTYSTNRSDVVKAAIPEDPNPNSQMINIKLDATAKLLLLLVIILLSILLSSIVFCKIYCIKKMLTTPDSSYNVMSKKLVQAKDTNVKSVKLNNTQDLINLSLQEPKIKEIECATDLQGIALEVPLMV